MFKRLDVQLVWDGHIQPRDIETLPHLAYRSKISHETIKPEGCIRLFKRLGVQLAWDRHIQHKIHKSSVKRNTTIIAFRTKKVHFQYNCKKAHTIRILPQNTYINVHIITRFKQKCFGLPEQLKNLKNETS